MSELIDPPIPPSRQPWTCRWCQTTDNYMAGQCSYCTSDRPATTDKAEQETIRRLAQEDHAECLRRAKTRKPGLGAIEHHWIAHLPEWMRTGRTPRQTPRQTPR